MIATSFATLLAVLLAAPLATTGPARAAARQPAPAVQPEAAAPATPLSDDELQGQVEALLGSIDTRIPEPHWRALGPRASALLEQRARDHEQLPSRRAKALDGLAAFGDKASSAPFLELAQAESEPLAVRLAALRGLGRVLTDRRVQPALQPLLEKAGDPRVRAVAAEVLAARSPAAHCALVRAQLARESEEVRGQFHRSARLCPAAGQ
jgi:hypothetical protein